MNNVMNRSLAGAVGLLMAIVIAHVAWYAAHPYVIDTIGRTNMVAALELAAGRPIYMTPDTGGAISMGYTPGFPLLGALMFKVLGFSRWVWSGIWAGIDLIVLVAATFYLLKRAGWFALLVPAAMLGCLFPVVWARGDVAAVGLFWLAWVLLNPMPVSSASMRDKGMMTLALAAIAFALSALFKQTMLPASVLAVAIWVLERSDTPLRRQIAFSVLFVTGIAGALGIMLVLYGAAYHENAAAMLQVITLGKTHEVVPAAFARYLALYAVATALPTAAALGQVRSRYSVVLLHAIGLSFLLYAAKDGGSWHHLLALVLPWGLCATRTRKGTPYPMRDLWTVAPALLVCALGFALIFRPGIATKEDISAANSLAMVFETLRPSDGDVMVIDSDGVFAFPEAAYRHGFHTRWERGALEEWSAATRSLPPRLLADIEMRSFQRIVVRGPSGKLPSFSAYGVPYASMNDAIGNAYVPCAILQVAGWTQYCRKQAAIQP